MKENLLLLGCRAPKLRSSLDWLPYLQNKLDIGNKLKMYPRDKDRKILFGKIEPILFLVVAAAAAPN